MQQIIEEVANGKWFKDPSPFRCQVQRGHDRLCIITGPNVSGKSLLRKILHARHKDRDLVFVNFSQEGRSTSHGLARVAIYGSEEDDSTGWNSIRSLLAAFKNSVSYSDPFGMMLDEPEIGCSEEVQSAMGLRLVQALAEPMPNLKTGVFVITHSREFVRALMPLNPTHWRLAEDNVTLNDYINRPVVPAVLEDIITSGQENWRLVEKMLDAARKK